jgi:hypothetical protein
VSRIQGGGLSSADDGLGGVPPTVRVSAPTICVWAEHREGGLTEATWELLGEGRELAAALGGALVLAGGVLLQAVPERDGGTVLVTEDEPAPTV